ncbi:uncharacterized protein MAM_04562 [Metarhizium album ARSEF 1941]|uniref:Uncharacterized protein n=1 Tax=Metarhizium album (strain ARSEF 1941) TaxID=1081103 RepID=A0A0B2WVR6_METAS|nr:uncharacterized protein MAM_04562 [Metarhizium album ARSEF 1941]KHN97547.1 hypothetical protein MAM_04562 [Metarhizium album ARSEF 1941]
MKYIGILLAASVTLANLAKRPLNSHELDDFADKICLYLSDVDPEQCERRRKDCASSYAPQDAGAKNSMVECTMFFFPESAFCYMASICRGAHPSCLSSMTINLATAARLPRGDVDARRLYALFDDLYCEAYSGKSIVGALEGPVHKLDEFHERFSEFYCQGGSQRGPPGVVSDKALPPALQFYSHLTLDGFQLR